MIHKDEFLGENYEKFRTDVEQIIKNLQSGEYTTEVDESKDPLETIMHVSKNNPSEYLNQCTFFKFLKDIYHLPYVENIIKFAEEHEFSLVAPNSVTDASTMELFVKTTLLKKRAGRFDVDSCFDLIFMKKTQPSTVSLSHFRKVKLLDFTDTIFTIRKLGDLYNEITSLESKPK